jgi:hypothetical protein
MLMFCESCSVIITKFMFVGRLLIIGLYLVSLFLCHQFYIN